MDFKLHKINGTNLSLDYRALSESIKEKLAPTCKKAEAVILNNFPVAVSSQSTIDFIVLLNIPKLHNSYYRIEKENERTYVKNQIIAVSLLRDFENVTIEKDLSGIKINGENFDFEDKANDLKWSLTNYLSNSCGLQRNKITVHPLFWLKSKNTSLTSTHLVVNEELLYDAIEDVISKNYYFKYPGYADWNVSGLDFDQTLRLIFEQASKDSETGYITKKKVERFQGHFDPASQKAFDNIGKQLVEVRGKAGTGKSSDLLKWMIKSSLNGKSGVFITYNHLLVFDVAKQLQSFHNVLSEEDRKEKKSTTTHTLHSFFYNIAKKLGVLMLLSEERINELINKLDKRWVYIEDFFDNYRIKENGLSLAKLKMYIQTDKKMDEGTKREAIDFIRYLDKKDTYLGSKASVKSSFVAFREDKIYKLGKLESSNVFLKDYTKVLERIRQATVDLEKFISDLNVQDKYELLTQVMNLDPALLEKNGSGKMDLEALKRRYKNSLNSFAHKRTVYIDEAQDCHGYERDIIYNLFGSKNVVIANGGKEQLIRYSELCNWKISMNKKIESHPYIKKRQSFRMKPAVAALANHIASYYDIDLKIEPLETEDHGSIIIDYDANLTEQVGVIKNLYQIGKRQGCTAYDSLILLTTPEKNHFPDRDSSSWIESKDESSVVINEFDNIVKAKDSFRAEWDLAKKADEEIDDFRVWNTTGNVDKKELGVPGSLSVRAIYYQSCRGIEAWSILCNNLDEFFDQKFNEDEAENYLLNDLFDQLNPDSRKNKYAATWVLMAITRAMENCYINLSNSSSPFSKCLKEFEKKYPHFVTPCRTVA
ncbi:hypothetical protein [Salinimicrobium sp. TH3]|uniref:hypothetical protein n=1 Tax=Salinimicrobium sp. TH3 TaxID=2997342 RepID=UPI002276BD57|nr:hypothetical protein [Salinimicrobium sp. TH3]MCY2687569.1 hypothetical protein [Salinimicrobium sp. TH3]